MDINGVNVSYLFSGDDEPVFSADLVRQLYEDDESPSVEIGGGRSDAHVRGPERCRIEFDLRQLSGTEHRTPPVDSHPTSQTIFEGRLHYHKYTGHSGAELNSAVN